MNIRRLAPGLVLVATLLSTGVAFADFTGSFSGFYAPNNWTIARAGTSPTYTTSTVITSGAPDNVTIVGAFGFGTVPSDVANLSTIDYSIVLPAGGAMAVSFSYFFGVPSIATPDMAQVLRNGVDVGDLIPGLSSQYILNNVFQGGDTLTFRVLSANINQFDFLEVAPIPEPSTLALAGLGGAAILLQLRRKSAKS